MASRTDSEPYISISVDSTDIFRYNWIKGGRVIKSCPTLPEDTKMAVDDTLKNIEERLARLEAAWLDTPPAGSVVSFRSYH